ncbi:ATP F0F1 synthase synthase [Aliivibrio wodanis]|uniref:ATP F0F1 synthase synthase n=1 Tax=Aliivibrio wodanis TaxID=80852 RepID=UPI00406C10C5
MSLLLIKPGHKRQSPLHIAISHDKDIYSIPVFSDCIEYTPTHKLEDDEWFCISKFKSNNFSNEFIDLDSFTPADFNPLEAKNFSKAKYICVKEGGFKFFQKLVSSNFIKKKMLNLNTSSFIEDGNIITINSHPDAAYNINDDKLYFKDLSRISALFKNIDSLYREATDSEVVSFLQNDLISIEGASEFKVGIPNRKKIALALEKLDDFTANDKGVIKEYIKQYFPDIPHENDKFVISTDIDLKNFIYGVEQRFYTTLIGNEKRVASAVFNIPSKQA